MMLLKAWSVSISSFTVVETIETSVEGDIPVIDGDDTSGPDSCEDDPAATG